MSDVFNKLSSNLVSNDFIETIIAAIATTNDDRLLFLAQKALDNGFYDDSFTIQNETLRYILKEVSMLRARGADEITIKESFAVDSNRYKIFCDILDRRSDNIGGNIFLTDIFREKIRNQVVIKNLQSIASVLSEAGNNENIKSNVLLNNLEEILTKMLMEMNINLDFREMTLKEIRERIKQRKQRKNKDSKVKVTMGLHLLDDILKGGLEKGRLALIASSPGYGKSTFIVNNAVEAARHGFNAWIITLENSLIETWARLDACISGITIDNLDSMSEQVNEKVQQFINNPNHGELLVKEFPADTMTVTILRNYIIQKVSQKMKRPDIIFVDYLDIIKSEKHYAQLRFELSSITKSLKKLSTDFDFVTVVPTQLNRSAVDEDGSSKGGLSNLAEAFSKAFEPDLLLVLRANKYDIRDNKFKLFIAKSRVSESRLEVVCDVNFAKMQVKSIRTQYPGDAQEELIGDGEEIALMSMEKMMDQINKKNGSK